jgi:hypothetical protein
MDKFPKENGFYWIQWFDKSWMLKPLIELAHYHCDHGLEFWSDEPDWSLDKMKNTDFKYLAITKPEEIYG